MYVPQKVEENISKALDCIMEDDSQGKIYLIYSCMDLLPSPCLSKHFPQNKTSCSTWYMKKFW